MSFIRLQPLEDRSGYRPGETLRLRVEWDLAAAPTSAQVRLSWRTFGKGQEESELVEVRELKLSAQQKETLSFDLPSGPYSYAGKLINITWSAELAVEPGSHVQRFDFNFSADGNPVLPAR